VHFTAEHRFPCPPDGVVAVLTDPDFYRELELPDLMLLDVQQNDGILLRYEFTGSLDPIALRLLGSTRLTWTQEVHLTDASGGWLTFAAEANPGMLHGRADFVLELAAPVLETRKSGPGGGAAVGSVTLRRLEGDLVVAIPVVGPMAERRIVPGVLTRLDVEADAVRVRILRGQTAQADDNSAT
jgi:hypothetical protein